MLRQSSRQSSMASAAGLVDKATSDLLIGPDWAMNLDICDVINGDPGQARDVVKHVKKRLSNRNSRVQLLALTVLETLIKNCGEIVHQQVAEKDVLHEMTKIVKKKSDMQVRDKILVLLDSWQEAFGGSRGRYPQYYMAFEELRRQGVEFPDRTPEHSVPIFTPPQSQPHGQQHGQSQGQSHGPLHGQPHGHGSPATPGYASPRGEAAMSTESSTMSLVDIEAARSGYEVLSEMLSALNPRDKEAVVDEVIMDLVEQSRTNQRRVMQLVNTTSDEELLGKGLSLNDDLQRVIAKHDAIASGSPMPRDPSTPGGRRFDQDEGTEDDFSPLSHRQSTRARPAAPSVSPQPAIPPPPGAKMTPMPSQREMTVDLLSGDSFEGAIVPVTVPSGPMQSTPPELALSSNPFDSDPAFHAVPAPPDPQPLYTQPSQPPQQFPFTNGFNSSPTVPPQQYGYQSYPPQQFQQGQPGQSQGMQSGYVVPWASSTPVPQQQTPPMYGQGPQSPTQVEAPWGNNNAPGLNQQQYAQQQFAQQQMSPQPMSPQQRAMLYGTSSSNATPVLPPPPGQHSLRQQYFQQQQQQQQQDFSGSPIDLAGKTQSLTLQEQTRFPQNQSLGGQSLAAAAAAAHRQQQQPSPSPPKEVNAADKLFEDLVDLSNPNSRFKTAGILSRGPRNTGSL